MHTIETQFPPLAQALGRLRQNPARPTTGPARVWPFALRLTGGPVPAHDLLDVLPEPALTGELPPEMPARQERDTTMFPGVPGAEAARTYWFDLL